ncbi:MAG: TIGR03761 family integrating conjugative element protein [Candidatus Sedimenticola sp. (ex Thyasira tokunagai)]
MQQGTRQPVTTENPIPKPSDADKLGPLRGQVWLTLQTNQARRLIRGRNGTKGQSPIIGLGLFAERLRLIWQASRNDDPYADWWLIKVHEAIEDREALFQRLQRDLDERLSQMGSIEVDVAVSERPYRMPLQFANPYAYQSARLVSTYDALVCAALTASHIGILDRASRDHVIELGARKIRGLFMIPQGYRFLRIERSDIQKGNDKSTQAVQFMGTVPDDVLSGERRAPLAPIQRSLSSGFSRNLGLHSAPSAMATEPSTDENNDA